MLFDDIKRKRQERKEMREIQFRNEERRSDINVAIKIAALGEKTALDNKTRSKHSKFKARAEAIRDRLDNIDLAIKVRDLDTAKAVDKAVENAIGALNYSDT